MNINEVEKHVKFDLIFTLLVILGVATCLLLTLAYIFKPINASALTETNVINGITAGQYCSSHPQASVCTAQIYQSSAGNPCGNGDARCITYFSAISDNKVMSVNFYLNTTIQGYTANTLTLYGSGFDNVTYYCTMSQSSCQVVRYSDHININFYNNNSTSLSNPVQFDIYTDSGFNSNKNFRLTGAKLFQNDIGDDSGGSSSSFDDSGIINNANQNTQDIINNNNTNAQETQNTINNGFTKIFYEIATLCNNILPVNNWSACTMNESTTESLWCQGSTYIINSNTDTGSITYHLGSGWAGIMSDYIPIEPNLNYYLSFNDTLQNRDIIIKSYDGAKNILQVKKYNQNAGKSFQVCPSSIQGSCFSTTAKYIRISYSTSSSGVAGENYILSSLKLNIGSVQPFCAYGSHTNKLDNIGDSISSGFWEMHQQQEDIKDIQQDTYDYLTDNTNPSVDTNAINSALSSVSYSNPLDYLLTLPTHLLQKINTVLSQNSCSRVSFGQLYGTELYLPCINFSELLGSNIWNTIDLFVGVGLLVMIIKHFYESISNILTLGKEKEVSNKLDLPTPMQFLAGILGGGRN